MGFFTRMTAMEKRWRCNVCTLYNSEHFLLCDACGGEKPKDVEIVGAETPINWVCEFCTYQNPPMYLSCEMCEAKRPREAAPEPEEAQNANAPGEAPAGEAPAREVPAREVPAREAPAGPSGEAAERESVPPPQSEAADMPADIPDMPVAELSPPTIEVNNPSPPEVESSYISVDAADSTNEMEPTIIKHETAAIQGQICFKCRAGNVLRKVSLSKENLTMDKLVKWVSTVHGIDMENLDLDYRDENNAWVKLKDEESLEAAVYPVVVGRAQSIFTRATPISLEWH